MLGVAKLEPGTGVLALAGVPVKTQKESDLEINRALSPNAMLLDSKLFKNLEEIEIKED